MKEKQGGKTPKPDETSKEIKKTLDVSALNKEEDVKDNSNTPDEYYETEDAKVSTDVAISKSKEELIHTPIQNLNTLPEIHNLAQSLMGAKMLPFKTVADAVIALIAGKELGLSLAATLGGIHPIEGRPSLGVHIKKGILLQNNVIYKRTHDMEQYCEYVDFDNKAASEAAANNKTYTPSVLGYGFLSDLPKYRALSEFELKKRVVDTRTEYVVTRYFKTPKGIIKNTATGIFGIAEAKQAGLLEKSNWQNYTRDMLASRAFSRAANEIADDLLHGMYSFSELADINDSVTYYIDENGHEQIVK